MNLDNNKNVVETARNMLIEESMYIMLRKEERRRTGRKGDRLELLGTVS